MAKTTNIYSVKADNGEGWEDHDHYTLVVAADSAEEAVYKAKETCSIYDKKNYSFEADLEFKGVTLKEEEPVTPWTILVATFLAERNIKHEVDGSINYLKIDRDSIMNYMCTRVPENDAYDMLRKNLNETFGGRFNYTLKTDDWLLLEKIA